MEPASAETPAHRPSLTLERTISSGSKANNKGFRAGMGLENVARRTLGMFLLGVTVMLWTSSNFLASVSCQIRSPIMQLGRVQ
jgi:hypothetical protein